MEKKNNKRFVKASFELTCICVASYVIYDQFEKYLKNEDSSSFRIKNFAEENVNQYPEISICFSVSETTDSDNSTKFSLNDTQWNKETFLHLYTGL